MKKTQQLYEGKAKKVYATDVEGIYIVDYKDDATAFNGERRVQSRARALSTTALRTIS